MHDRLETEIFLKLLVPYSGTAPNYAENCLKTFPFFRQFWPSRFFVADLWVKTSHFSQAFRG